MEVNVLRRETVRHVLEDSEKSPKAAIARMKKGVSFKNFDDWLLIAKKVSQASLSNPHTLSYRKIAMNYPEKKIVKDFNLFFNLLKSEDKLLVEQARALIFRIQAKSIPVLKECISNNQEQTRVMLQLKQKKQLGDVGFYQELFKYVIKIIDGNSLSFMLENGEEKQIFSDVCEEKLNESRILTIYGPATLLGSEEESNRNSGGIFTYLLPDGYLAVKKINLLDYNQITLNF